MKKIISLSVIVIGFTAMASQIVFIRELLVVFYGNELSIGFILASWLAGGAIGSGLLGRYADRVKFKLNLFLSCQIILSLLLPLGIVAIRLTKNVLHINPGEIIPLSPMAISGFVILAPVCVILGFMFSLACRIYDFQTAGGASRIGRVYVLEALGAMAGGVLASFILIRCLDSLEIMGALAILNIICSLIIPLASREVMSRTLFLAASNLILAGLVMMWPLKGWSRIESYTLTKEWAGYDLIASKNSIYGNVAITKKDAQTSFFDNGLHLYTIPDIQNAEERVHYALLENRDPKDILLVGGGVGGLVSEALKHPVERIDYVELDPMILNLARLHLPEEYYRPLEGQKVYIHYTDGRSFIKNTDKRYDCIIVDLGDPLTAQINRYYTVEFFREAKKALKDAGLISFGLGSSENYINAELGKFLRSIYTTLKEVFADVLVIPGDTAYFLATDQEAMLTYDYGLLMKRAGERKLDIKYVREYYLSSKLSDERIACMEDCVSGKGEVNCDFRPISYYYAMLFLTARFRGSAFNETLKSITEEGIWKALVFICLFILLSGAALFNDKRRFEKSSLAALSIAGFVLMTAQIIACLAFQVIYGYLYYKLGVILTSYMAGLALGGWFAVRMVRADVFGRGIFIGTQALLSLYLFMLPALLGLLAGSRGIPAIWLGANIIFPLISVIAGFIGGFQFPLANKIYLNGKEGMVAGTAGLTYGIDLLGSCLGALFAGGFLIPVMGIPKTCYAVGFMSLAACALLFFSSRRSIQAMLGMKN
ncbi:MAG: fused MFS/spermidine synthase [Candidatus Omnitrophica bacterium]|nr:fused MFS/spermidine synthase [Candidatus Omnitrophota bacterium]